MACTLASLKCNMDSLLLDIKEEICTWVDTDQVQFKNYISSLPTDRIAEMFKYVSKEGFEVSPKLILKHCTNTTTLSSAVALCLFTQNNMRQLVHNYHSYAIFESLIRCSYKIDRDILLVLIGHECHFKKLIIDNGINLTMRECFYLTTILCKKDIKELVEYGVKNAFIPFIIMCYGNHSKKLLEWCIKHAFWNEAKESVIHHIIQCDKHLIGDRVSLVNWCIEHGCKLTDSNLYDIGFYGRVRLYLYNDVLDKNNKDQVMQVVEGALESNNIEILRIVFQTSYDIIRGCNVCNMAASLSNVDTLKFVMKNGFNFDDDTAFNASMNSLEMLKFCLENGAKHDERIFITAAQNNNVEMLKYAKEFGCEFTSDVKLAATIYGCHDVLKYLSELE